MFTFKQFILENNDKPKVKYNPPNEDTGDQHHFEVTHPLLKKTAHVHIDNDGETDIIDNEGKTTHMGDLGHTHVRHVLGRIKYHLPNDIDTLYGGRTTGSRKNTPDEGHISIKHIKPIPPDKE